MKRGVAATFSTLLEEISLGVASDDEIETQFLALSRALLTAPLQVHLLGVARTLQAVSHTPRGRGIRARVADDQGHHWLVNLDLVECPEERALARVIDAYRSWLGYRATLAQGDQRPDRASVLDKRVAALRDRIEAAGDTLADLDYDEMEQWIGDDDLWGRYRQDWSRDAEEYAETLGKLEDIPEAIEAIWSAGETSGAIELLKSYFEALEIARFEHFCPDDLSNLAREALGRWLRIAPSQESPDAVLLQFGHWLLALEAGFWIEPLFEALPAQLEPAALRWLESATSLWEYPSKAFTSILCALRLKRREVDVLLERVPVEAMSSEDVIAIVDHLSEAQKHSRALELVDAWLVVEEDYRQTADVEASRRALMSTLGDSEGALKELWASFDTNPTAPLFDELRALGEGALLKRAVERIARNLNDVLTISAHCEPHPALAAQIAVADVETLKTFSSWTLQDVASHLDPKHPSAAVAVYTALGWRHVDRGKAKYYHLALEAFGRARELYRELGREEDWRQITQEVKAAHSRKSSFMPGFRRLMGRS